MHVAGMCAPRTIVDGLARCEGAGWSGVVVQVGPGFCRVSMSTVVAGLAGGCTSPLRHPEPAHKGAVSIVAATACWRAATTWRALHDGRVCFLHNCGHGRNGTLLYTPAHRLSRCYLVLCRGPPPSPGRSLAGTSGRPLVPRRQAGRQEQAGSATANTCHRSVVQCKAAGRNRAQATVNLP